MKRYKSVFGEKTEMKEGSIRNFDLVCKFHDEDDAETFFDTYEGGPDIKKINLNSKTVSISFKGLDLEVFSELDSVYGIKSISVKAD